MSGYTTYKQVLFNGGSFVFMHGEFHKGMCFCYVMVLEWIQWVLDTALYSWVCRRKMAGNLKHEIRSYIKIRSKLGEKPMKIHETLQTVYGDDAPRYPTVCKWAARFRVGRDSIDDDVRFGEASVYLFTTKHHESERTCWRRRQKNMEVLMKFWGTI